MQIQDIPLELLLVNRTNDRHGELVDEDAAIEWLLKHRSRHMRNLTKDIAINGGIFEPPLVRGENGKYCVYDGNRRTTCLKLLSKPSRAPSLDWQQFYIEQRSIMGAVPDAVECQVEQDRERIDEMLYRRHTGQKEGIGQSRWDPEAKTNFERRTGKNAKVDLAEEVEKLLRNNGLIGEEVKIPRSNFKRLFSSEPFRNRVGIAIVKNKIILTHNKDKVLDALGHVVSDLVNKNLTLDGIWDNDSKRAYLNKLEKEGILPTAEDAIVSPQPLQRAVSRKQKTKEPLERPAPAERRRTLVRAIDFGIKQTHENRRALDILEELQHRLKFDEHDNAIAVLFRVVVELSTKQYIDNNENIEVGANDKLSKKFSKTVKHMKDNGAIDNKYYDILKKFENSEPIFSANTLNAYVHSDHFFPSDHHLKMMWDTLERYIIICLKGDMD